MRKRFFFLDNCVWIYCVNFSLLRRENLWPAVNVFTNSPKILHIIKRNFSIWIAFTLINKYVKGAVVQISTAFGNFFHAAFRKVFRNGIFQTFIWPWFSKSIILKIYPLWGSFLFENVQSFIYISKMQKDIKKIFFLLEIIPSELALLNCLY